ncbi:hypothetical protein D3C71_613940 [compost metagenome]
MKFWVHEGQARGCAAVASKLRVLGRDFFRWGLQLLGSLAGPDSDCAILHNPRAGEGSILVWSLGSGIGFPKTADDRHFFLGEPLSSLSSAIRAGAVDPEMPVLIGSTRISPISKL